MLKPTDYMEIFLQPGEFFFADASTRIRTLLGSCVALTMWHPKLRIGGMCHCMLPERKRRANQDPDGKYVDEAIELFRQEIARSKTSPKEYEVKLFGGGNMFPGIKKGASTEVGTRNIARCLEWVENLGVKLVARHVGDIGHRNVMFDVWSGDVWVKHQKSTPQTVKP
jgi:chemotaxis protein CheD